MAVFDPTQGFNAFAAGAQIGGNIRKSQTQRALAPMLANNDYEGAMKYVAGRGDLEAMDYIRPMQEKAAENAFSQKIGGMIASGDRKGAAATAYGAGKFEIGAQIEAQISQMTKEQRETAAYVTQQIAGVGMSLLEVKDPAQRVALWQQKQQELAALGMDPQQLAQFDPLNDALIESKIGEAQTIGQRLEAARWQQSFDREGDWRAEDQEYRAGRDAVTDTQWQAGHNLQAGKFTWEKEQAAADAEAGGTYGLNVVWGMDAQGNYVPMQAGKSGGLIASQMPEGVTPLGPYGTAFDSASGKAQAEKAALQSTAGKALLGFEAKADELVSQIDQAIEMSDFWNTGLTGNAVWSPDFNAILDSIGAKAMLSELVSIKEQGGTFGALSDSEGKALRDAAVNITKSQSEAQLDKNLKAYRDQVEKTRANMRKAFEEEYINNPINRRVPPGSGGTNQPAPSIGPPVGTVRNGYRFKGGNPNDRNSWEPAQ